MARIAKPSVTQALKTGPRARQGSAPLPRWIPPQLCQSVETAPSGPQWLHEIKLDGFRIAARIDRGRVQLLTRTGLDWSDRYPGIIADLTNVPAKSAYLDGELCGVGDDGLPSFSRTKRRATASAEFGWSTTLSTFCISTAATPPVCHWSTARRFWSL